jgi:hypothetical protein
MKILEIDGKTEEKLAKLSIDEMAEEASEEGMKWGVPLQEMYKLSTKFYKGWKICSDFSFICCYQFVNLNR